jgi:hypothetical protein
VIFISHNSRDKVIVEPIAVRLAQIFGQDKVFYDSWSIQPGDGIIDKMSAGLQNSRVFFFFVSANSLQSKIVSLEWQNALLKATRGQCKFVPVRMDGSEFPPILAQTLYIDLYSVGLDAAIGQMVDVVNGQNTFRQNRAQFANLCYSVSGDPRSEIVITIEAMYFLEPIANCVVLVRNNEGELAFELPIEGMFRGGFNKDVRLNNGNVVKGQFIAPFRGLTPGMPLQIKVKANGASPIQFTGLMHQKRHDYWEAIPQKAS